MENQRSRKNKNIKIALRSETSSGTLQPPESKHFWRRPAVCPDWETTAHLGAIEFSLWEEWHRCAGSKRHARVMSVCRCSLSTQEDIGRLHLTLWNISLEPYLFQASAWLPLFVCLFWTPKDVHCMMWIHKHVRIFGPEVRHSKGLRDSAVVSSGNDFISDVFQHCRKTAQIHAPSQVD